METELLSARVHAGEEHGDTAGLFGFAEVIVFERFDNRAFQPGIANPDPFDQLGISDDRF